MSVAATTPTKTHTIVLTIRDTLDFTMSQDSWEVSTQGQKINFVVDLANMESIKDSGYDLLWMLKECADREQADISIIHCTPCLHKELCELGLDQYFRIDETQD
ncbi:conserved hypothetical protein [Nitrosococcus halophilus Nc 4]|uniref:STAS domain-containing protein n=1 Tax=Nitrosococcus halophilus (strain Nc4) TaxID=472759 RepID=D5BW48_NITHN|nr:hypothetical protein [Nitrosococcus halophilus]ADE13698.1 conserved hypothetical protein [Nitrosococcus halophilus Nc 4]